MEVNCEYRPAKLESGWRKTWHTIHAGRFADTPHDGLFFYDQPGGVGEFCSTDGLGNTALLMSHRG